MSELENDAARLKSLAYLLSEAQRIADDGGRRTVGAKIADCIVCVDRELAAVTHELEKRGLGLSGQCHSARFGRMQNGA